MVNEPRGNTMEAGFKIENSVVTPWPQSVVIHTDGACRGNPGPSSVGITVTSLDGDVIYELAETLGSQTNNFAEYSAVKMALALAFENKVQSVTLKSDSQLLIRQLIGEYKVKAEGLKPLFLECRSLVNKIGQVDFEHVRREFNKRADALANQALDEAEL